MFIDHLIDRQNDLSNNILTRIDGDQVFSTSSDIKIVSLWASLKILLTKDNTLAEQVVTQTGQIDILLPIYRALLKTDQKSIFDQWIQMNAEFYTFAT